MADPSSLLPPLPQFQSDYLDAQRKQMLAQALMQQATAPMEADQPGWNQMRMVPRASPLSGIAKIGQSLLAGYEGKQAMNAQAKYGQEVWGSMGPMFGGQAVQQPPQGSQGGGMQVGNNTTPTNPQQGYGSPMNPAGLPPQVAQLLYMQDPAGYQKNFVAPYYSPTDASKMAMQGGMNVEQANRAALAKATNIAPPEGRPGGYTYIPQMDPTTGQVTYKPQFNQPIPQGGIPIYDASGRQLPGTAEQPGAANVAGAMAAAKTGGEGSMLPYSGYDASGQPLPVMSRTQAATGGQAPLPIRNNNPGAVSPGGQVANYPNIQAGMGAMDQTLAGYASDPNVKTIGDVVSKWVGSPTNAPAYVRDVATRLGVSPNTPVDLSNPMQRSLLGSAIAIHENGPGSLWAGGAQQATAGGNQVYGSAPLGAVNAANASQTAPSKQMASSYSAMSNMDAAYQQSRQALTGMMDLAGKKGVYGTLVGALPSPVGTRINTDAAEYQKLHATYVALQGKALGSAGTDSARETINESVPTYDKPPTAMAAGLNTQLNNLDMAHLKTQYLTPIYQRGDEKSYTQQSAAFDQNMRPSMMPILQMQGDQRRAAVQAAVKANPSLRPNFEWAYNNGLLQ